MPIAEIILLAIALAMDAFSVSITQGMLIRKKAFPLALKLSIVFGFFQALMPLVGYLLGTAFASYIQSIDHWIAFILLGFLGIRMIRESLQNDEIQESGHDLDSLDFKTVIVLAVATSIDALASGIAISFLELSQMLTAAAFIGITTFTLSFAGVYIGQKFGGKFKAKAEFAGGAILILLGTKILLEHLGILGF